MITKAMKLVSIAALLLAAVFWSYASDFDLAIRLVVSLGAFLVARQAGQVTRYYWGVGFYCIALLFNPFLQLFAPAGRLSFILVVATAAAFAVSLSALKPQPLRSIASITD